MYGCPARRELGAKWSVRRLPRARRCQTCAFPGVRGGARAQKAVKLCRCGGEESKIEPSARLARRALRTRSDRSREVPPRLLRAKAPGRNATRGVSPLVAAQQTTLTLADDVTAPAPQASPAPPGTSAPERGLFSESRTGTACLTAAAAASPDGFCAPPPVFWEWPRHHTITSPAARSSAIKHQHRSIPNAAAAGHHHRYRPL